MLKIKFNKLLVIILLLSSSLIYGAERADGQFSANENFLQAIADGDFESVKQAIASGADVNFRAKNGTTPLDASIVKKNLEIIKFLIDNGADVNMASAFGLTPLMRAIHGNRKESKAIVKLLLKKGANVNAALDFGGVYTFLRNGYTALHVAAITGNTEIAVILLLAGANINARNSANESAYELAKEWDYLGTAAVLQAWSEIKKFMEDEVAAQLDETRILLGDLNKIVAEYAVGYTEEESKESSEK